MWTLFKLNQLGRQLKSIIFLFAKHCASDCVSTFISSSFFFLWRAHSLSVREASLTTYLSMFQNWSWHQNDNQRSQCLKGVSGGVGGLRVSCTCTRQNVWLLDVFTWCQKWVCVDFLRRGEADRCLCHVVVFTGVRGIGLYCRGNQELNRRRWGWAAIWQEGKSIYLCHGLTPVFFFFFCCYPPVSLRSQSTDVLQKVRLDVGRLARPHVSLDPIRKSASKCPNLAELKNARSASRWIFTLAWGIDLK